MHFVPLFAKLYWYRGRTRISSLSPGEKYAIYISKPFRDLITVFSGKVSKICDDSSVGHTKQLVIGY